MPSATITLFLVHGDASRLRTAKIANRSILAVAAPRSELDEALARAEAERVGVYVLSGNAPDSGEPAIYVGKAEDLRSRVRQHLNKAFWGQVCFFVSADDSLTTSHVLYLEGRLIQQIKEVGRSRLDNAQASGSRLPEHARADMESFLLDIHQLLPVLGENALVPNSPTTEASNRSRLLYCRISTLVATGQQSGNRFVVFKGSQAALKERPAAEHYPHAVSRRRKLIEERTLAKEENCYRFSRDVEFSSPSAAAAVIHGGSANGLTAWKNSEGKTLKQLEAGT